VDIYAPRDFASGRRYTRIYGRARQRNQGRNDAVSSSLRARKREREKDCPRGHVVRNPGESNWLNARLLLSDDGRTGVDVST